MSKTLAVIRNPGIGMRDLDEPALWFDTYINEFTGALQLLTWDQAKAVMRYVSRNAGELEGKACWVDVDGPRMTFLCMFGDEL